MFKIKTATTLSVQLSDGTVGYDGLQRRAPYLFACHALHLLDDLSLLVGRVQVRYIAGVENHADIFHETLILDLTVGEQEHRVLAFTAGFQQQLKHTLTTHSL